MAEAHDLAMSLRAAYLAMHRRTGAELAHLDLSADQFVLLTALAEGDAVSQKILVDRTASDPNTMSERLARLERRGLIRRDRPSHDARSRSVSLTDEGRRLQEDAWRVSVALRESLQTLFQPGILNTLVEHLNRIAIAMASTHVPSEPS